MTHSWFVKFDKDFNSQFPLWFICWWTQFGPITNIFPKPLTSSFKYFTSFFKTDTHGAKFLATLYFVKNTRCRGPWNGNMSRKAIFLLDSGLSNDGTSFPTSKMLLIMLPRNSQLLLKALLAPLLRLKLKHWCTLLCS